MEQNTQPAASNRFRKKPVVIEAITFDELVQHGLQQEGATVVNGMPWSFTYKGHPITHENDACYLIPTKEGTMNFTPGDMLITGVQGEIYPCKLDIFAATYEPAGEPEQGDDQAPDALIEIRWNGTGFNLSVQRGTDLSQPAAHLADWIGRNSQPLMQLAAAEWHLRRSWNEELERRAAGMFPSPEMVQAVQKAQNDAQEQPQIVAGTPRLVGPDGGPLQ